LGLRFEDKIVDTSMGYRLFSGIAMQEIELVDNKEEVIEDSDYNVGYEIGAALTIDLTPRWRLTPGISYRAVDQKIVINRVDESVDLDSTVFDIGLSFLF